MVEKGLYFSSLVGNTLNIFITFVVAKSFGPGYYEYCLCLCRDSEYFINTLFSRIHTFIIWGRLFAALQYSMKCLQAVCSK